MKHLKRYTESARYESNEVINNMPNHAMKFMSVLDPNGFEDAGYVGSKDHKKACKGMVEHYGNRKWYLVSNTPITLPERRIK